jgi:hypothetical protein
MLGLLKKMFGVKSAETATEIPYKVETPVVQSPAAVEVTATQAMVESVVTVKKTPAKKTPAKKPATANKPRRSKSKA